MNTLVEHANKVLRDNPEKLQQARANSKLTLWFVGQIMKATNGGYTEAEIYRVLERRGLVKPPIFIEGAMNDAYESGWRPDGFGGAPLRGRD